MATITPLRPPTKDRTNAERSRRFRARRKAQRQAATVDATARDGTPISTPEMCALASRLADGRATMDDLRLADRVIMALVRLLPRDSTIKLPED